jgi:hypothetical protein
MYPCYQIASPRTAVAATAAAVVVGLLPLKCVAVLDGVVRVVLMEVETEATAAVPAAVALHEPLLALVRELGRQALHNASRLQNELQNDHARLYGTHTACVLSCHLSHCD